MPTFLNTLRTKPQFSFVLIATACVAMLGFGLYLQHVVGLEPCPMCIVQRYALIGVAVMSVIAALCKPRWALFSFGFLTTAFALFGAFVAARQSWLQWYPPEVFTCGRDFYGIIENIPLKRAIPMIFKGSGDCTKVDWTLLGGSIANWSFVCFVVLALLAVYGIYRAANVVRQSASTASRSTSSAS